MTAKLLEKHITDTIREWQVEVILILVVLIGLVLIFKKQLVSLVNSLMEKVTNQSNTV